MRSFVSSDRPWSSNARRVHVYLLPDRGRDDQLGVLIDRARLVTTRFGCVSPVEERWLHVPLAVVPSPEVDRGRVVESVVDAVRDVSPFEMTVGSVVVGYDRIVLDCDGDAAVRGAPFSVLQNRVVTALARFGGRPDIAGEPVHMMIAYGRCDADSGEVAAEIRQQVRTGPATFTVDRIVIVDVQQDPVTGLPTWREIARVGLRREIPQEKECAAPVA